MFYLSLLLMGLLTLLAYNLSGRLFLCAAGSYSLGVSAYYTSTIRRTDGCR